MAMKIIRFLFALLALSVLGGIDSAGAASFDCKQARRAVERSICADPQLSKLDELLDGIYTATIRAATDAVVAQMQLDEREWLRKRNACLLHEKENGKPICESSAIELYRQRIQEIIAATLSSDCDAGSMSAPDLGFCLSQKARAVDVELEVLNAQLKAELRDSRKEIAAQSAWLKRTEKECLSGRLDNGPMGGAQNQDCLFMATERRIQELRDKYFCGSNVCSSGK